jgi:hypothetical protein
VGRFLGRGFHQALVGRGGRLGVLILPKDCGIFRAEPGEPLCFQKDRAGRLHRWRRTMARMHAPACRGSDLVISVDSHTQDAAGTVYSKLDIVNRSRRPCTVVGVPSVLAVGHDGKSVRSAEPVPHLRPHSHGGRRRIWLREDAANFTVTHSDGIAFGRCKLALTYGLR